jgi:hypothetical protein
MPLSPEQKRQFLLDNGYDPERYDAVPVDELGQSPQPEQVAPQPDQSTAGGAFFRGAKRAAIPTAAGILATAGAASLLGPGTQPLAAVLLPLAAGIGASTVAGYGQEKLANRTPEEQAQLQADVREHPMASLGGELVPSLAAFKPSLSNVRTAFTKMPKVAGAAEEAARRNIVAQRLNVGLGAGMGAVQEGAMPLIRGEEISPARLAMAMAAGGLINEPNKLGNRLGFRSTEPFQPEQPPQGRVGYEAPIGPQDFLRPSMVDQRLVPPDSSLTRTYRDYYGQDAPATEVQPSRIPDKDVIFVDPMGQAQRSTPRGMNSVEVPANERALPAPSGTIERLEQEIAVAEQAIRHLPLKDRLPQMAILERAKGQIAAQRKAQAMAPQADPAQVQQEALAGDMAQQFPPQPSIPPQVGIGDGEIVMGDNPVGVTEGVPLPLSPEVRLQQESALATQPLETLLADPANAQVFRAMQQLAAQKRIQLSIDPALESTTLGMADLRQRIVKLNPARIAEDTGDHEIAHILLSDMLRSSDPSASTLAQQGLAIVGGDEERLIQAVGMKLTELHKLRIEGRTLQRFKNWLKDALSWVRSKWGNATQEDFARLLARRMMGDTPSPSTKLPDTDAGVRYQKLVRTNAETRRQVEEVLRKADEVKDWSLPGVRSVVDSVKSRVDPKLGDAFAEVARLGTRYAADFRAKFEPGLRLLSPEEQENALAYLYDAKDTEGNPTVKILNDNVQDFVENVVRPGTNYVADTAEGQGKLIVSDGKGRKIQRTPYYFPEVPRQDVLDTVNNKSNSPEATKLLNDMYEHIARKMNISKEKAIEEYNKEHGKSSILGEGESDFGPLSRAAGIGLPASWRENSLQRALLRYSNRSGKALGYFAGLQKDPHAAYLAGVTDQFGKDYTKPEGYNGRRYGGDREVRNALSWFRGDYETVDQYVGIISRAAKTLSLQTLTGAVDVISAPFQILANMQAKDLPKLVQAFKGVPSGIGKAIRMGAASGKSMLAAEPSESGMNYSGVSGVVDRMHGWADKIFQITGRDALERMARGYTYNVGELLAWSKIGDAFSPESSLSDRRAAVLFLREHAPKGWERDLGGIIERGEPVPDSVVAEIAASVVEKSQGSYDIRGLPSIALRGQLSPFLSFSKWSIERWNNFNRQVIGQARRGNLTPLLMVTVGGWLGGEAVEKLREAITRKKPQHATWDEIFESGGDGLISRLAAMATYSGYAGILADVSKQVWDVSQGNQPMGFQFPAVAMTSNTVERLSQAFNAVDAGENPIDVFGVQLPLQWAKDNVQLARIGIAWSDNQAVERANRARDLRRFREVSDLPNPRMTKLATNPFKSGLVKQYDEADSPQEALALAPQVRKMALERSRGDDGSLDVERLRSSLRGIKTPPPDLMPSARNAPRQFGAYLDWIKRTQGEAAALGAMQAYQKKQQMDRLKGALIPSL